MAKLTMPKINISFSTAAASFIARGERGTVLQIVRDRALGGRRYSLSSVTDIPEALSGENQTQVKNTFIGYVNPPKKVLLYVVNDVEDAEDPDDGETYTLTDALNWAAAQSFDILCAPADVSIEETETVALWVKSKRANEHMGILAVLPDCAADHESVVNFATDGIVTAAGTYTAAEYCSRIAGLIAGTPLQIGSTYAVLPEVTDVERLTEAEQDAAVGAGKFILFFDKNCVRCGRAVNSLTTTTDSKGDAFKKIKIVSIVDQISGDIREAIHNDYIGKYANSYDNKLLVVTAIRGYLESLEADSLIDPGWTFDIDTDAQRIYLKSTGLDTDEMSDQEIREANTGTHLFLSGSLKILDAMEDVDINFNI